MDMKMPDICLRRGVFPADHDPIFFWPKPALPRFLPQSLAVTAPEDGAGAREGGARAQEGSAGARSARGGG
jgi:hypothetical protein